MNKKDETKPDGIGMANFICEQSQRPKNKHLIEATNQRLLALIGHYLLKPTVCLALTLWGVGGPLHAQNNEAADQKPLSGPDIINPEIERNKLNTPKLNDTLFESAAYIGLLKPQGFETKPLAGLQLTIHPLDWAFIEANYGVSRINDDARESVGFPSIIEDEKLEVLSTSLGIQVANSQILLNRRHPITLNTSGYLSVGAGNLKISVNPQRGTQKHNTVILGVGFKLILNQWLIINSTMRDHISDESLLDKDSKGHNLEFRVGIGVHY